MYLLHWQLLPVSEDFRYVYIFFSPDSKQAVVRILEQVNELSTAEKLLLYLKLPTGRSGKVDPLRQ
jgi:hypothetical protein